MSATDAEEDLPELDNETVRQSRRHDTKIDMQSDWGAESLPHPLHGLHTPLSQCGVAGHIFFAVNSDRHTGEHIRVWVLWCQSKILRIVFTGVMEGEVWQDMAADVEGDLPPEDLQAHCCYGAVKNINFIVYKEQQETYIQVLLRWMWCLLDKGRMGMGLMAEEEPVTAENKSRDSNEASEKMVNGRREWSIAEASGKHHGSWEQEVVTCRRMWDPNVTIGVIRRSCPTSGEDFGDYEKSADENVMPCKWLRWPSTLPQVFWRRDQRGSGNPSLFALTIPETRESEASYLALKHVLDSLTNKGTSMALESIEIDATKKECSRLPKFAQGSPSLTGPALCGASKAVAMLIADLCVFYSPDEWAWVKFHEVHHGEFWDVSRVRVKECEGLLYKLQLGHRCCRGSEKQWHKGVGAKLCPYDE
ncbi:hypothetical protein DFH08DRAFT_826592 [Mycena albidolilacea]|uniref:Uncharacterized protein n=1 Tax=Mycena albidolilacea TaxID=1033008 RepID=A0AAD6Z072_9AGAR|nr:hypothetical protein DFH08DRAFT_826592 [Mycena albidolilacea]